MFPSLELLNSKSEYRAWEFVLRVLGMFRRYVAGFIVDLVSDIQVIESRPTNAKVDSISYLESYDGLCERLRGTDH